MSTQPTHPPPRSPRPTATAGWGLFLATLLFGIAMVCVTAARLWVERAGTPVLVVVDRVFTTDNFKGRKIREVIHHYDLGGQRLYDDQEVSDEEADRARPGDRVAGRAGVVLGQHVCAPGIGVKYWRSQTWTIGASGCTGLVLSAVFGIVRLRGGPSRRTSGGTGTG